jgi:hypothetical protein
MKLAEDILAALDSLDGERELMRVDLSTSKQNQLLFFLKPETFLAPKEHQLELVTLILSRFEQFNIEISGCVAVAGPRLQEASVMDRHYGYINAMSRSASSALTPTDRNRFLELLNISESVPVLGGHEVLTHYSNYSPASLNDLWSTKKSVRVRSGLYGQIFLLDGTSTLVVNGFHPSQLTHFTDVDRKMVLFVVNSDLPWATLRRSTIGDTFPGQAAPGSIRRLIYENSAFYGLDDVSVANNYCHLSAGPFEALFELNNFFSSLTGTQFKLDDCRLPRYLASLRREAELPCLLENPILQSHPEHLNLFHATEDCDLFGSVHLALTLR